MNSTKDKFKGTVDQGIGRLKQGLAKDTGDSRLADEGRRQESAGGLRKTLGHLKDSAEEAIETVKSAIGKPKSR